MTSRGRLASLFSSEDGDRTDTLEIARQCSRLTVPWHLPDLGRTEGDRLFRQNQSLGKKGVSNLQGKLLLALYPPDQPFFEITLDPEFQYDPEIPDEFKQAIAQSLWLQQLQTAATLESAEIVSNGKRGVGFRVAQHHSIGQMITTGDTLEEITDDYTFKVHRRDRYVTRRDDTGCILYHLTKESVDPLSLTEEDWFKAQLDIAELRKVPARNRMTDILTHHEWQPRSQLWVIEQEVNGYVIRTSEEPESRVFSTPFELITGENYGHGFVEGVLGDLQTLDTMKAKLREAIGNMARMVPVLDTGSPMQEEDLLRPSGEPIRGRVNQGQVQDAAFLQSQKHADIAAVAQYVAALEMNLSKAFLLESAIQPQKERVTAAQVGRIAEEVDGATGGLYIPISEAKHLPLLRRVRWQMKRDKLLPAMPDRAEKMVRFRVLTGLSALAQQAKMGRMLTFAQTVAAFGPDAMRRIDTGVLAKVLQRASNFYEPGLVKSDEQMEQEQQQAIAAQARIAANEQIAKTAGKVVETAAAGAGV
jgi:hypothetical protein